MGGDGGGDGEPMSMPGHQNDSGGGYFVLFATLAFILGRCHAVWSRRNFR